MKKLFLLLTAVLLSAGMVVQAQLLDAVNESPEGGDVLNDNGQVSGRNNAPQANDYQFSWSNVSKALVQGGRSYNSYCYCYVYDYNAMQYTITGGNNSGATFPAITLYLTYDVGAITDYGTGSFPGVGTYSYKSSYFSQSASLVSASSGWYDANGNSLPAAQSKLFDSNGNSKIFTSGSVKIEAGRHGLPYIYSDKLKQSNTTYNITIGDSRALSETYTTVRVATDTENGKGVLWATNNTNTNTITLVFDLSSFDASIGIPIGTYTIGTNVWGGATDDDGYTRWTWTSGTVTISKSNGKLNLSTSSLIGKSSGSNFNCSLTISNKTPNKNCVVIDCPVGMLGSKMETIAGANYYPQYISGYNDAGYTISWKFPYTSWSDIANTNKFSAYNPAYGHNDAPSANYITTPASTTLQMPQGIAHIDYTDEFRVAEVTTAYLINNTFYYVHVTTNQVSSSNDVYLFKEESSSAFGPVSLVATTPDDTYRDSEGIATIGANKDETYGMDLSFYVDKSADGIIPSGSYDIRATQKTGTALLGSRYSSNFYGSCVSSSEFWLMRHGYINVFNLNETYYITSGTVYSSHNKTMTFTIGEAPKDITLTTPAANGTAQIQFTATNWDNKVLTYASGTAHKFFQGQTLSLQATPASDYQVAYWTLGGVKINGSEGLDTYSYTVGSAATQTLAVVIEAAASAVDVTLDPNDGTTGNEQIVSATNGQAMTLTLKAGGSIVAPTFSGYNFGGYVANSDGTGKQYYNYTTNFASANNWDQTEATTIYAKWTQTVTLDQNGATTDGTLSVTATYNGTIGTIANNPSKTGYDFGGWCDASGSLIINTSGELQSNVTNWTSATGKWIHAGTSTLYAKWTQTVTLNQNGGSANGTVTVTYNANTTASFFAVTGVPVGYSALKGYYDAATGGNKIFNADGTLVSYSSAVSSYLSSDGKWNHNGVAPTIYAQFTPNTNTNYTVKHWQQNLADNDYTEVTGDRQQLQGTTDDATAADANTYPGFTAQSFDQGTIAGDGSTVVNIYYNRDTYTVNLAVSPAGYGSVSPSAAITGVRYGTVITTGTGENANKVTINETVVTANPAATTAEYTYTFDNWINGTATVTGSGLTVTANFTRTVRTYDITFKNADGTTLKKSDEKTDAVYSVAYGETPAYDGATPTKAADSEYTYTFNGWDNEIVAVTTAATYTATYSTTKVQYTLAWDVNGGNALTGTYTNGTMDWGTDIVKPADPTKDGYAFNGWDADNNGTADEVAATMPTSDVTYKALWTAASHNITLCENCNDAHYNTFKVTYGGSAGVGVNVTYPRQFTASRWSTMCLPFSLDLAAMIAHKMYGCVYEFKYATGNANVGSGVNLYFSNAKSIEAGKCYIVNANAELAAKTSFVFSGVTIDLTNDKVATLTSVGAYNKLPGYKSEGTIELVGTLRNGTLQGSATGNTYMGLKENKIYYPNTATGSTIWAYRGIFRSTSALNVEKMRIIVDGEDRGELILDADGEILNAGGDVESRKFIENGVLYIEREGVIYDAQGKRVEGM